MIDQVGWIKDLNERILSKLAEKRSTALARLNELRKRSDDIQKMIDSLDAKKDQILAAEELQIAYLQLSEAGETNIKPPDDEAEETAPYSGPVREKGKIKARIGEQRYLVLSVFRTYGATTQEFAIFRTQLPDRRVREAIVADVDLGVIERVAGEDLHGMELYQLTPVGDDLMQRFDDYRRQKSLHIPALPSLDIDDIRERLADVSSTDATDEAVGTESEQDAPTASVSGDDALSQPLTDGSEAVEGQVVHEKIDNPV